MSNYPKTPAEWLAVHGEAELKITASHLVGHPDLPQSVEYSAFFLTEEAAQVYAARFPKGAGLRVGTLSFGSGQRLAMVSAPSSCSPMASTVGATRPGSSASGKCWPPPPSRICRSGTTGQRSRTVCRPWTSCWPSWRYRHERHPPAGGSPASVQGRPGGAQALPRRHRGSSSAATPRRAAAPSCATSQARTPRAATSSSSSTRASPPACPPSGHPNTEGS